MNVSAAWVSVTQPTYGLANSGGTNYFNLEYNRRPGIYLNSFTLSIKITNNGLDASSIAHPKTWGLWRVPYNAAPLFNSNKVSDNSIQIEDMGYTTAGVSRTATELVDTGHSRCFTGAGNNESGDITQSLNLNKKYWYRVYPYNHTLTASVANNSILGGASTVTFTTPECSWPTYYNGTNSYNNTLTGSLWPDVLVSYSTSGTPADPTYDSYNVRATYNSSTKKTTASASLAAGQTYYVKARLAVDNGYSDRQDVEYGTVNSYVYYTYPAPTVTSGHMNNCGYTGLQQIKISGVSNSPLNIRYTTDGNNPASYSPTVANGGTISINRTTTLKLQQYSGSVAVSPISTYNFTIYYNPLTASPAPGTYTAPQAVTLGNGDGMTIRYTTDGSEPTASSPAYTNPIPVGGTTTIKARRFDGSTAYGNTTTFNYTINLPKVTALPAAGTYPHTQEVALSGEAGIELYYTLDGSAPSKENGTKYTVPILITDSTKVRVQQYRDDAAMGGATDFNYVIQIPAVKASPAAGTVVKGSDVTLSLAASDAEHTDIFYTLDAEQPREKWTAANFPIRVDEACTIYAVAQDKVSKRYGEVCEFAYDVTETGYILNDLSFWQGGAKVESTDISALAGKTVTAKANITKIIPSIQGWLVTALYDPSGHAQQIKLDKLDQISGITTGDASGKAIALPADVTNYVLKTFIVHDFINLRPIGAAVQIGGEQEE